MSSHGHGDTGCCPSCGIDCRIIDTPLSELSGIVTLEAIA